MKGLKKVALASAIAAVSAGAQAELKALDDSAMGELTGQAGITIDVETAYRIGEFAYQDIDQSDPLNTGGFVVIQDIELKANENETSAYGSSTLVDNFRMTIDVANGDGTLFDYGMSEAAGLAAIAANVFSNSNAGIQAAAAGALTNGAGTNIQDGNNIAAKRAYGDGDLIIHFGFTDAMQKGGGLHAMMNGSGTLRDGTTATSLTAITWAQALDIATAATDYQLDIGVLGIASSAHSIGNTAVETHADLRDAAGLIVDNDTSNTALLSGISIKGYQGPDDLHISNNGNGFSGGHFGAGSGAADSQITWGDFFKVTDLDVYIDIAGVAINDLVIADMRGDLTSIDGDSSFGFAHSIRTIYAVNEDVVDYQSLAFGITDFEGNTAANTNGYKDGVAINTRFKGDMDITHLSFGDEGQSIGSIYLTDIDSTTNWTISAH